MKKIQKPDISNGETPGPSNTTTKTTLLGFLPPENQSSEDGVCPLKNYLALEGTARMGVNVGVGTAVEAHRIGSF